MHRLHMFRNVAFLLFVGAAVFGMRQQTVNATSYFPSCDSWDYFGAGFALYECTSGGHNACNDPTDLELECDAACAAEYSITGDMYICYSGDPSPSYPDPNGYCMCWF